MKILLALDASPASKAALDAIAKRPWPAGSKVEVLTVVNTLEPWALAVIVEEMKAHAHQLVDSAAMHLHLQGLAAEGIVSEGDPKHVILDHARELVDPCQREYPEGGVRHHSPGRAASHRGRDLSRQG